MIGVGVWRKGVKVSAGGELQEPESSIDCSSTGRRENEPAGRDGVETEAGIMTGTISK